MARARPELSCACRNLVSVGDIWRWVLRAPQCFAAHRVGGEALLLLASILGDRG